MLHVELENILTEDELGTRLKEILGTVDEKKELVVVTRGGHPAVAVINLEQLEELSGRQVRPAGTVEDKPAATPTPTAPAAPMPEPAVPAKLELVPEVKPASTAPLPLSSPTEPAPAPVSGMPKPIMPPVVTPPAAPTGPNPATPPPAPLPEAGPMSEPLPDMPA